MTGPDVWRPFGGKLRRFARTEEKVRLNVDPIFFAAGVLLLQVLVGMEGYAWLAIAIGILTKKDVFERHVAPQRGQKFTTFSGWHDVITKLLRAGVLKLATGAQYAWGTVFLVAKGNGLGRFVFNLSLFSRLCKRPIPVNLPFIPELVRRIGLLRRAGSPDDPGGWCWSADYKNWFFQVPIPEWISRYFTISVGTLAYQFICVCQGWSWSSAICASVAWGIVLGEFPAKLRHLIDWESLKGDTVPSYVMLRRHGVDVGIIVLWIDNIFVVTVEKQLTDSIRTHIVNRSKSCRAAFKVPRNEEDTGWTRVDKDGWPVPDDISQSGEFIGMRFLWGETQWVWRHIDVDGFNRKVPLLAERRFFASVVGSLIWDATITMENMERLQPALDVIRRITKGVSKRPQWREIVRVTEEEAGTLRTLLVVAYERQWIYVEDEVPRSFPLFQTFVYVASDASKYKVAWVEIPALKPLSTASLVRASEDTGLLGNFDFALAVGSHIFYSELQAAVWAITEMCLRHKGVCIVIATDNSAVFYVLRRGFTGTTEGAPYMEALKLVLRGTGNHVLPVLIPGLQNVADAPTRAYEWDLERFQITWRHLVTAAQGGSRTLFDWGKKRSVNQDERMIYEEAPSEVLDEIDAFDHRDEDDEDV